MLKVDINAKVLKSYQEIVNEQSVKMWTYIKTLWFRGRGNVDIDSIHTWGDLVAATERQETITNTIRYRSQAVLNERKILKNEIRLEKDRKKNTKILGELHKRKHKREKEEARIRVAELEARISALSLRDSTSSDDSDDSDDSDGPNDKPMSKKEDTMVSIPP